MTRAGKNKQNADYYLIAANGFISKEYKIEEEQVDEELDETDTSMKKS